MTERPEGAFDPPTRFGADDVVETARDLVSDQAEPAERRLEVLRRVGGSIARLPGGIDTLMEIAAEPHDDPAVRRAATSLLGEAASETARFRPHRTAYVDLLRSLISDPVPELRDSAVTTLAAEQDEVVQQVLVDGLQGRVPLPVERNRAIELLAEDDRQDTLPWLRQLYASTQEGNRVTAVRLMGMHPAAEDEIARILQEGTETTTVRLQGAAALRTLAPERFAAVAKEIVLDPDDDTDVRAGCLDSLRFSDEGAAVHRDLDFLRRLRTVAEEATGVASLAQETLDDAPRAPES
jgi:HEAT repeat protein